MSATETERLPRRPQPKLATAKGNELLGLMLGTVALLLAASLASYHPADPSFLHEVPPANLRVHNWVGVFGAELSALLLGLVGLTALTLPLILGVPAFSMLRRKDRARVPGRGAGLALLLLSLPVLLQLAFGPLRWRGEHLDAGGVLGRFLAEVLESRFNLGGSLLLVGSLATIGLSLVVQPTLADVLAGWQQRLMLRWERVVLAWSRYRQRREKEKLRKRVVSKHLKRRDDEAADAASPAAGAEPALAMPLKLELDLPLRVERRGGERDRGFGVRKVRLHEDAEPPELDDLDGDVAAVPASAAAAAALPAASGAPQPLLFQPPSEARLPPLNLLNLETMRQSIPEDDLIRLGEAIRQSCAHFGVEGTLEGINPGPVITVFELKPAPGVKMSQVVNLQDDLALALQAESVRIDRLPGRSTLGIEVPNRDRALIRLGPLLSNERFRKAPSPLTMALGLTMQGEPYFADLATMPHVLVAGATGAGKSVGLQSMITSILYKATRDDVQFIFIDPKRVELGVYSEIPHLKAEVVVEPKKAANALRWAVAEMERRYRLLAEVHVRSIDYYNRAIKDPEVQRRLALEEDTGSEIKPSDLKPLPYYVIVIDELADLMMVAANEVETSIARLAQMARAVGIHLIVATQRPSVDVITGTIKANFPCRIAFATTSRHDARTILDQQGSEKLLGKGDMLVMPPGTSRLLRVHGSYISEQETAALVRWLKKQGKPELDPDVLTFAGSDGPGGGGGDVDGDDDELFDEAARLVVSEGKASASYLQRRMRIGFSRAARLIDLMEREGLLGPAQGSKPREVLVPADYFAEVDATKD